MSLDKKIIIAKTNIKDFLLIIKKTDKKLPLISFSGGKDSCVLRHLVHEVQNELGYKKMCNSITAFEIFNPFTFEFIKNNKQNGDRILPPFKNFAWILKNAGYPIISKQLAQKISHIRNTKNHRTYIRATFGLDNKNFSNLPLQYCHFLDKKLITYKISHKCCDYMKGPVKHNSIPMFVGTTISESRLRRNSWLKYGCNYFGKKKSICRPISL
jgi:predicted phosphoadenosine phosphosulfate sulfurtransferase